MTDPNSAGQPFEDIRALIETMPQLADGLETDVAANRSIGISVGIDFKMASESFA